jgi:hypothetical protein
MRGKKAKAIRKKFGVKHVRLARPRIVQERREFAHYNLIRQPKMAASIKRPLR